MGHRASAQLGVTIRRARLKDKTMSSILPSFLMPSLTVRAKDVEAPLLLPAETAGTDDLKAASGVARDEARDVAPDSVPRAVNTEGRPWTQAAWKLLVPHVVVPQGFWHASWKIRDRAKPLKDLFAEISRRAWEADHAPDRRRFGRRLRRLRQRAVQHLSGVVLEKVLDLRAKRPRWSIASRHPDGHRASDMRDRLMWGMNRPFEDGRHLHGPREARRWHCRAWALLWNFTPWHPATTRRDDDRRCPAERPNRHRYHDCWLRNLLTSASPGGYRHPRLQNP